jgi:hypothetical protein
MTSRVNKDTQTVISPKKDEVLKGKVDVQKNCTKDVELKNAEGMCVNTTIWKRLLTTDGNLNSGRTAPAKKDY